MLPCPPVHWKPSSRLVLLVPNQSSSSSSATMSSAAAAAGVVGCSVATTCPCRWSHPDEAEAEAAAEVVVAAGVEAGVVVPGAALSMTGVIAVVAVGVTVWFGAAATGCTEWHRRVCCAPFVGPQREQHCRKPGFTARPHPCTSQRYCVGLSWSRRGAPRCGRARAWSAVAARRSRCC